ncbi:MAG: AraC family transcriptional regulator [Pseudomonas sp.]|uniref:helix-turn-helix transcriptional regulator n=1 Tax=Pseudomonas sp. TaxID=306 RepID=UPI0030F0E011
MHSILSLRHYSDELIAHSHEHAQIVFGLNGRLAFEVEGQGSLLRGQQLLVIPGGAHHACESREGSDCMVFDVPDAEWLHSRLGNHAENGQRLLDSPHTLSLGPAQQQLVSWLVASPIQDPVIAQQGAALLLASLASAPVQSVAVHDLPLASLDRYIDQHAAHPLQVADLARVCGLSASRLHARFLQQTGQTPMDYVRNRRLQLAMQLLRDTSLAVGDIAQRVGYNSQSAFTAALARRCGTTPRQLRGQH